MFNLAEALWRTGRRKDAATVYQEYLDLPAADGQAQFRQFAAAGSAQRLSRASERSPYPRLRLIRNTPIAAAASASSPPCPPLEQPPPDEVSSPPPELAHVTVAAPRG